MIGILAIIALLPAAGVLSFFVLPILIAIIITIVGSFIAYYLLKYVLNILRSHVDTGEQSIRFVIGKNDEAEFRWDGIDFVGYCTQEKEKPFLYFYREEDDKLLTVPDDYLGFAELVAEVRGKVAVEDVELTSGQTINEYLKDKLGDESGVDASSAD